MLACKMCPSSSMDNCSPSREFEKLPFYSAHFMDPVVWELFIRRVAECHGFGCQRILPGLPGTYPTFIVEHSQSAKQTPAAIVVKFFGPLFEGTTSFQMERAMGHFTTQHNLNIHTPAILAEGRLSADWCYLVFEHIRGVSIGQVHHELSLDALKGVAVQMGKFMNELHTLTATCEPDFPLNTQVKSWDGYADFLENQRAACLDHHRNWQDIPSQLIHQLPGFILPLEQLIDFSSPPHLVHADLTADHLLGRLIATPPISAMKHRAGNLRGKITLEQPETGWENLAVIDWGDCRVGNILYELVALHLDMFRADKRLLHVCMQAYSLPDYFKENFARKALSTVLLHQFPMPAHVYAPYQHAHSLDEVAEGLFGI